MVAEDWRRYNIVDTLLISNLRATDEVESDHFHLLTLFVQNGDNWLKRALKRGGVPELIQLLQAKANVDSTDDVS